MKTRIEQYPNIFHRVTDTPHDKIIKQCAREAHPPAGSNFDHASNLTETVLLSNVAIRARRKIEWDSAALKITILPEANQYLTESFRPGFGV